MKELIFLYSLELKKITSHFTKLSMKRNIKQAVKKASKLDDIKSRTGS